MRVAAALVSLVGVLLLTGTGQASEVGSNMRLSARLVPGELTDRAVGVHSGARGTFSASFWPYRKGWESVRWALATRRLTGPALTAHIHTGTPGRRGPILITLCTSGRCSLGGASFHALPAGYVRTMRLLGAYVDVHTKRNPRGELRGQVVIR